MNDYSEATCMSKQTSAFIIISTCLYKLQNIYVRSH